MCDEGNTGFMAATAAEETCTLRQDVTSGGWELTEVEGSDPR